MRPLKGSHVSDGRTLDATGAHVSHVYLISDDERGNGLRCLGRDRRRIRILLPLIF